MFEPNRAYEKLGYRFQNEELLRTAFTHASYANAHGVSSYEELEFLGDSVLQLIVTEYLYRRGSDKSEGEMTSSRAAAVSREPLTRTANRLGLAEELSYVGEAPPAETKVLSDVYESVIGAIYLDAGLETARQFVMRSHGDTVEKAERADTEDYKSKLQELVQSKEHSGTAKLTYRAAGETEIDRRKTFTESVIWQGKELARANGLTRKDAQKEAARLAYITLTETVR